MAARRPLVLVNGALAELPAADDIAGGQATSVQVVIDGGGSAITSGVKAMLQMPFAGAITGWTLLADQAGSAVVDLWRDSFANAPPTIADTITASAKPTLSSAAKASSATLTGWTTGFAADDVIAVNVDSAATVTRLTLVLKLRRS